MLPGFDVSHSFPAAAFKTFGIRLEEVLMNELTRRKHLELTAAMQVEDATGSTAGRRRRGNVVQRMFGRLRRFFSRRRNEPTLPREFTRRGRRVSSILEVSGRGSLWRRLKACALMVWGQNRNRRGWPILPQRDCKVLNVIQHLGRSQWMLLLLHFMTLDFFPTGRSVCG